MVTRFITSQRDHGGYLCVGVTTPKACKRVDLSLTPPLASRVRLSRVLPAWQTPPCLPSFPLFTPILPLHSPSTTGTTKRNGVFSSTITAASLPDAKPSKLQYSQAAWCLGTNLRGYRTLFAWSQLQQRERQWKRAHRRRPTALETQGKKTTKTEARSSLATIYACTASGWSIPGKIWMPTNQIRVVSAGAHVSRELRARAPQASRGI